MTHTATMASLKIMENLINHTKTMKKRRINGIKKQFEEKRISQKPKISTKTQSKKGTAML